MFGALSFFIHDVVAFEIGVWDVGFVFGLGVCSLEL